MLKPHKFMDINKSVLGVASYIVNSLIKDKSQLYDKLLADTKKHYEDDIEEVFILALTFLYSVGVVEYIKEKDQVKYTQ